MFSDVQWRVLTLLPSRCQKTVGWGFPLVSQGNVAVCPWATIWSRGRTTNWGASEVTCEINTVETSAGMKCIEFMQVFLVSLIHPAARVSQLLELAAWACLRVWTNVRWWICGFSKTLLRRVEFENVHVMNMWRDWHSSACVIVKIREQHMHNGISSYLPTGRAGDTTTMMSEIEATTQRRKQRSRGHKTKKWKSEMDEGE